MTVSFHRHKSRKLYRKNNRVSYTVYKAYEIKSANGKYQADIQNPLVVKEETLGRQSVEDIKQESKIANAYHNASSLPEPVIVGSRCLVFMKYLPGNKESLFNGISQINNRELFNSLSFSQRIELLLSIASGLNQMHNTTLRSEGFAHLDIKPDNLRIYVQKNSENEITGIQTDFCDFGSAEYLANDTGEIQTLEYPQPATYSYMAPEFRGLNFGPKTDVFSVAPIFYALLGASNPLSTRKDWTKDDFDTTGLLEEVPDYLSTEDKAIITAFLKKMGDKDDYNNRPDSEQILRFFLHLHHYCLMQEKAENGKIMVGGYDENGEKKTFEMDAKAFTFANYLKEREISLDGQLLRKLNLPETASNTAEMVPEQATKNSNTASFADKQRTLKQDLNANKPKTEKALLIDDIKAQMKKIEEHGQYDKNTKSWGNEDPRYPQKYKVLAATLEYIEKPESIDNLRTVINGSKQYDEGSFGRSVTGKLLDRALELNGDSLNTSLKI